MKVTGISDFSYLDGCPDNLGNIVYIRCILVMLDQGTVAVATGSRGKAMGEILNQNLFYTVLFH